MISYHELSLSVPVIQLHSNKHMSRTMRKKGNKPELDYRCEIIMDTHTQTENSSRVRIHDWLMREGEKISNRFISK